MVDLLGHLMTIMLFVSHITSSYPCPKECYCYNDTGMLTANCTSLPASSEQIQVLNLNAKLQGQGINLNEGQFTGFKKLKYLNLSNSSISSVHKKSFFGVKSLVEIDLSYNNIHSLDSAVFQHITNLTTVVLRGNHFNFVSDDPFLISNTIEHLDIGDCGITFLPPGLFYSVNRIKYIMLDKNQLKDLKYNSLPRGLVYLNLSNNSIVNIPTDFLGSLKHLRKLDLSDNPINCTCALMNLQDHLSGLGVTFEHEVICAFPPKYEGVSWNKVYENELCIQETLHIPIKTTKHQETFNSETFNQILENEKKNYFDVNIQSDQPFDIQDTKLFQNDDVITMGETTKHEPNAEVLFQNNDTRGMGEMMTNKDSKEFDNQELKNSDIDNQEANLEEIESHYIPSNNDEIIKKSSFDDIHTDSEPITDSENIVESFTDNIDSFKKTTDIVEDLEKNNKPNEEFGEQNDDTNINEETFTNKVQEFKGMEEHETQTKSVFIDKISDVGQNVNQEIESSEKKPESENNKIETEEKELNNNVIETTTLDTNEAITTSMHNSQLQNLLNNEEKEVLLESSKEDGMVISTEKMDEVTTQNVERVNIKKIKDILSVGKTEETPDEGQLNLEDVKEITTETLSKTENIIEEVTTQNAVNEDIELVSFLGVNASIHTNEKLKLGNGNVEHTTNQIIGNIETENIIEAGKNAMAEETSTKVIDNSEFEGSSHEGTEEPKVEKIIEAGEEIKNNENTHGSDIVEITENVNSNIATEIQTEPSLVEIKNNVEETIDKDNLFNQENQPIVSTTDPVVLTTLKSETDEININTHLKNIEENSKFAVKEVGTSESLALNTSVVANETLIEEAITVLPTMPNIHDEGVESLRTTTSNSNMPILVNQENISNVTQHDLPTTETLPAVDLISEVISTNNVSMVLENIKQGKVQSETDEDDKLIGDKSLKEIIPMEFEPAHVVLGCIIVLISVLVLVAIYKCTTEGKKTSRTPKDVESNQGTEMQDMASLLPKPNNEEPKIISKKYPDEAPVSETVSLIREEKKDVPTETKPSRENEISLNNNTPSQTKPANQTSSGLNINPTAPIQRTRVKVGIIPESIPRTPIFVQKSYNNGVTSS